MAVDVRLVFRADDVTLEHPGKILLGLYEISSIF